MSKEKYSVMHIVVSPQDKEKISEWKEQVLAFLEKYYLQWILSDELGDNSENAHFDVVGWRKKEERGDNEAVRLRKFLGILQGTPEYKHAVKCYGIEDESVEWQVGYNRKEDGKFQTSDLFDCDIDHCKEKYKLNPNWANDRVKRRIAQNKKWSLDQCIDQYVKYLEEKNLMNGLDTWVNFRKENKEFIKYSVFSKIDEGKLDDYLKQFERNYRVDIKVNNSNVGEIMSNTVGFMNKF